MIERTTDAATLQAMSDAALIAAYERTDGEDEEAAVLIAEIERRELDI